MSSGEENVSGLKEELVGHSTLLVLALLGLGFYSLSYSLLYTSSSSVPIVAVFEMWMVSSHLGVAGCSLLIQSVGVKFFRAMSPMPFVAATQTSVFFGIALLATLSGVSCVGGNALTCQLFYGASTFPSFSSVASLGWAWIMYVSSLGCQTWNTGGFTLGINNVGLLLVSSILVVVPNAMVAKVYGVCPAGYKVFGPLCGSTDFLCAPWVASILTISGLILFCVGCVFRGENVSTVLKIVGIVIRISGIVFVLVVCVLYVAVVPTDNNGIYLAATICAVGSLVLNIVCSDIKISPSSFSKTNSRGKKNYR